MVKKLKRFKIPSFNFGIETEEVLGRSGSVVKQRQLKEYKFELPLIVRNDYLSSDGIKHTDDVLNELVKFLITIIQSLYNLNHKMVLERLF